MNQRLNCHRSEPVSFFDGERDLSYPLPEVSARCPECGDWEWEYVDHDWEDGQTNKKWVSFRCQGRKFTVVAYRRHGPPDGYYEKCEFVFLMPLDEATRIEESV